MPLDIVFEDANLLAINKPSGLLSVPGLREPDNLYDRVRQDYPNGRVVHRLDMPTSGLILFALNADAQSQLSQLFEKRRIKNATRPSLAER